MDEARTPQDHLWKLELCSERPTETPGRDARLRWEDVDPSMQTGTDSCDVARYPILRLVEGGGR